MAYINTHNLLNQSLLKGHSRQGDYFYMNLLNKSTNEQSFVNDSKEITKNDKRSLYMYACSMCLCYIYIFFKNTIFLSFLLVKTN